MNLNFVIHQPVITEKSYQRATKGMYTFKVDPASNKHQIKQAIEEHFKVHVTSVRTITVPSVSRRTGRKRLPGKTSTLKKAIVTLKAGETIPLFETTQE